MLLYHLGHFNAPF